MVLLAIFKLLMNRLNPNLNCKRKIDFKKLKLKKSKIAANMTAKMAA